MALIQVSVRLNPIQLQRAQKALGAKTTSEHCSAPWIWSRKRPCMIASSSAIAAWASPMPSARFNVRCPFISCVGNRDRVLMSAKGGKGLPSRWVA